MRTTTPGATIQTDRKCPDCGGGLSLLHGRWTPYLMCDCGLTMPALSKYAEQKCDQCGGVMVLDLVTGVTNCPKCNLPKPPSTDSGIVVNVMIRETRHTLFRDRYYVTYHWEGPATGVVGISHDFLAEVPDPLKVLPYPLKLIHEDVIVGVRYYIRTDGPRFWSAAYWALRENWHWFSMWVFSRLLLTLEVLGLAYNDPGQMLGWWSIKNIGIKRPGSYTLPYRSIFGKDSENAPDTKT